MLLLVTCPSSLLHAQFPTCTRLAPKTVLCAWYLVYQKNIIFEGLLWFLFFRLQTIVQLYILGYCSSVGIGFNMDNKRHTLPLVYTMLSFNHYVLFYSELNEVYSNYFWILKWLNLHCNRINLISIFNFPKQWIADYRSVFRTLSKI